MATKFGPRYKVPFRRRRQYKTNYRYRLRLLKSNQTRAVIRKSLNHTRIQFIKYDQDGDLVLVSASSNELRKLGWDLSTSNLPAAYLTGLLAGLRATEKKIDSAVLDIGLHPPIRGSKLYASLRGILDAGVSIPHGDEIFPDENRISGKHISDSIPQQFDKIKNKILEKSNAPKVDTKVKDD